MEETILLNVILYYLDVSRIGNVDHNELIDIIPWKERIDDINRQKNPQNRRLSIGAGALLYYALNNAGVKDYTIAKNEYGKPYLISGDISFNISHSKDIVICGITSGRTDIGVDVEYIRKYNPGVFKRYFSDKEKEWADNKFGSLHNDDEMFTRLWTIKESYVKMTGTGIEGSFAETDMSEVKACVQTFSIAGYLVTICTNNEIIVDFKPITLDKICFYRYK